MKKETKLQTIIRKSGMQPSECRCQLCQKQCATTSCLGTPDDVQKLIDAGFARDLEKFVFISPYAGNERIHMYRIKNNPDGSGCSFFKNRLCELHDAGLKPTEGVLANHKRKASDVKPGGGNSVALLVARTWDTESYLRIGHQVALATFLPNLVPAWEEKPGKLVCGHCQTEVANKLKDLAQHTFHDCSAITDPKKPPMPLYSLTKSKPKNEANSAPKHSRKRKTTKDKGPLETGI